MAEIRVVSLVSRYAAPIPWEHALWLEREIVQHVLREARREGSPAGHHISFSQRVVGDRAHLGEIVAWCHAHDARVLLMPSDASIGAAMTPHFDADRHLLLHQNLDPVTVPGSGCLRLGIGTRVEKLQVAAALMRSRADKQFLVVTSMPLAGTALEGVEAVSAPQSVRVVEEWVAQVIGSRPNVPVLLECGGEINRAIARALGGSRDVVFLNGNPDTDNPVGGYGVTEIVGNLPDRVGGGLAAAVAEVTGGRPTRDELDTAGMMAWRIDAVQMVIDAADRIAVGSKQEVAAALRRNMLRYDGQRSIFHGLHRPVWFDRDGRNLCTEVTVASVDRRSRRRVTSDVQFAPVPDGVPSPVPVLGLDVDFVSIGRVDESEGTFEAEVIVTIAARDANGTHLPSECLRVLNAVGNPEWVEGTQLGDSEVSQVLRGNFRFSPDLMLYPMDQQCLSIQISASGECAQHVMRPLTKSCDVDCEVSGWRVVGPHRGVTYRVRTTDHQSPRIVQGMEFGVRISRVRRDVSIRVGLPLVLLTAVAGATVMAATKDRIDVTADILGGVFLSAVALHLSEPKPATGARTLVDAVYLRAFLLYAGLLVAALLGTMLDEHTYRTVSLLLAGSIMPAWIALLLSVRGMVGPARWRMLRTRWVTGSTRTIAQALPYDQSDT
jgi:hypothetical protein